MEILLRTVGVSVIALVALIILRGASSEIASLLRIAITVFLSFVIIFELSKGINEIKTLSLELVGENSFVSLSIGVMLKALGIALLAGICSDICRACGENGIAQGVEAVAGVIIFSLSLPVLKEILSFASELLGRGAQ